MEIAFLGGIFLNNNISSIIENSKGSIQFAADGFQKQILKGLHHYFHSITLINFPFIGYYPLSFKQMNFFGGLYCPSNQYEHYILNKLYRFSNIPLLKERSIYLNSYNALQKWVINNVISDHIVIVYSIYPPFLKACKKIKQRYPNTKFVLIAPDLPQFMGISKWFLKRFYIKTTSERKEQYLNKLMGQVIDAYVILTAQMYDKLPIKNKPYKVIEGICPSIVTSNRLNNIYDIKIPYKYILYTGTLDIRYGIEQLISAFKKINKKEINLVICGAGNGATIVQEQIKHDKRIIYLGQRNKAEVELLQQQGWLLINPRQADDFTKYSFPSKTMEYFVSGTPILMYKLPGIPSEYYDYCYTPKDNSVDGLTHEIERLMSLPQDEIKKVGERARKFVLEKKNEIVQIQKLYNLINDIYKD